MPTLFLSIQDIGMSSDMGNISVEIHPDPPPYPDYQGLAKLSEPEATFSDRKGGSPFPQTDTLQQPFADRNGDQTWTQKNSPAFAEGSKNSAFASRTSQSPFGSGSEDTFAKQVDGGPFPRTDIRSPFAKNKKNTFK